MAAEQTSLGTSRQSPDVEITLLQEEQLFLGPTDRFTRVLTLFEFRRDGVPVALNQETMLGSQLNQLEIVGVVGTIIGKEGLFAQCGWFGNHDLDWFWCRIDTIRAIEVRRDQRFRGGDYCVWLDTAHGDYAMLLPHKDFIDLWEESLHALGEHGHAAKFQLWPPCGVRPSWWDDHWRESWPFDQSSNATSMSMDIDGRTEQGHTTGTTDGTTTRQRWLRLGSRGDTRNPGEPRAHLHQRDPWCIVPDTGLMPTRGDRGETTP